MVAEAVAAVVEQVVSVTLMAALVAEAERVAVAAEAAPVVNRAELLSRSS